MFIRGKERGEGWVFQRTGTVYGVVRATQCHSLCRFEAHGINGISREGCRNSALFKIHACCASFAVFLNALFVGCAGNVEHANAWEEI